MDDIERIDRTVWKTPDSREHDSEQDALRHLKRESIMRSVSDYIDGIPGLRDRMGRDLHGFMVSSPEFWSAFLRDHAPRLLEIYEEARPSERKYPMIDDLADLMRTRMEIHVYKDDIGWRGLSNVELLKRLKKQIADLEKHVARNFDWAMEDEATDQLLDAANYIMMLADNAGILED